MPYKVHCRYTVLLIKYFLIKWFSSVFYMKINAKCCYFSKQFVLDWCNLHLRH